MQRLLFTIGFYAGLVIGIIARRIKAACRTNDAQISGVTMFTGLNLCMLVSTDATPSIGLLAMAVLMWPAMAFLFNLIDPLPNQDTPDSRQ